MGTRGKYGLYYDGKVKSTYNHLDSYPEELGREMLKTIIMYDTDFLKSTFDYIKLIDCEYQPSIEEIKKFKKMGLWRDVSSGVDLYSCLRETQGSFKTYIERIQPLMIDNKNDFMDLDFGEFGYLIDLDRECLKIFVADHKYKGELTFEHIRDFGIEHIDCLVKEIKIMISKAAKKKCCK